MARVTIEDCLKVVDNMYELVHVATKRARQLHKGSEPLVKSKNRTIVVALREVATGQVKVSPKKEVSPQNDELAHLPDMPN